jgi:hypothetical protein
MADQNASVFDMTDFTVTRRIAQSYMDDVKVPIDQGAASGSRITGTNFLDGIKPGQEQILIHSGDQSIHIDETQWVRIKKKRDTEVGEEELYANKAKYDHQVYGEYVHKHHNKTTEDHVLETTVLYRAHVKVTENQGDTRIRNIHEKIIIHGDQSTIFYGARSLYLDGTDSKRVDGSDFKEVYGVDTKSVLGADTKMVTGIDTAISGGLKNSITFFDLKAIFYQAECFKAKATVGVFMADAKALLLRGGGLCAKVVQAAIGSVRF